MISSYVSLMTNNVKHIFLCLLATCLFYLIKRLFKYFAHFNWIVCHLIIEFHKFFIYSGKKSFIRYQIANIFPKSITCIFIFIIFSCCKNILSFMKSNLLILFYFMDHAFDVVSIELFTQSKVMKISS